MRRTSPGWQLRASWQRRKPASQAPAPAQASRQALSVSQWFADDMAQHLVRSNPCLHFQCIVWSDGGAAMIAIIRDLGCRHSKTLFGSISGKHRVCFSWVV